MNNSDDEMKVRNRDKNEDEVRKTDEDEKWREWWKKEWENKDRCRNTEITMEGGISNKDEGR